MTHDPDENDENKRGLVYFMHFSLVAALILLAAILAAPFFLLLLIILLMNGVGL